jgi:hypothetical protein
LLLSKIGPLIVGLTQGDGGRVDQLHVSDHLCQAFLFGLSGQQLEEKVVVHGRRSLAIGIGQCAFSNGLESRVILAL